MKKKKYKRTFWFVINDFKNVINSTYAVNCYGDVMNVKTSKILHKKIANKKYHPYYAVYLKRNDGTSEWYLVHQLVANYFVEIPDRLQNISDIVPDHLDNDGLNNFYMNLEWKTRGENVKSAFKNGFIRNECENNKSTNISNKEVHKICQFLESDMSYNDILDKMGYPNKKKYRQLLVRIKNGIAWKDISKQYNIKSECVKYTESQLDTINRLPEILRLYKKGYTASEIYAAVYRDHKGNKDTKLNIIRNVCKHRIFKSEISQIMKDKRSTTIES